jgi:tRNA-Thr(GGU) m(6)t(6)A37 methyltransferase TsaA
MFDRSSPITLQVIGVVHSDFKEPTAARLDLKKIKAEIEIDPELAEALEGLVGFSHIIVLYWLHRAVFDKSNLKTYPIGNQNVPLQGLFAVRTPKRPNPIGKSTVRLLSRRDNVLYVQGLDAIDGSLVLDIKPYIPGYDSAADATVPDWVNIEDY